MKPDTNKIENDLIKKKNFASTDREFCRICPSKLTKHELEDLYFSLLEANWQQKRTINEQAARLKSLMNVKQTRDPTQKVVQADEMKNCCIATKCVVHQQKQSIINLRRENERLAERIRRLNIKLSSAKQFNSIPVAGARRTSTAANNSLVAARENARQSVDLQTEPLIELTTASNMTQTEISREQRECDENICRTQICQLEQTIVILREELCNTHKDYTDRISRLEKQVLPNSTVHNICEEDLSKHEKHMNHLMNNLRAAGELSNELKTQLSIEKKKVTELVMQLKDLGITSRMTHDYKDSSTNTVDSKPIDAEPESNGSGKCDCPHLSPQHINRLIQLYHKRLSWDEIKCSKCCGEVDRKPVCDDAIKNNDDAVEVPEININSNQIKVSEHNVDIQPDRPMESSHSNYNEKRVQDALNSEKQQSLHSHLNIIRNLYTNRTEDKWSNKIELPDHNKIQPLDSGERYQVEIVDENIINITSSNYYQDISEATRNIVAQEPKQGQENGQSKDPENNLSQMETRSLNRSTSHKSMSVRKHINMSYYNSSDSTSIPSPPELSARQINKEIGLVNRNVTLPNSICNDDVCIGIEGSNKNVFGLNDNLLNDNKKENELNISKHIANGNILTEKEADVNTEPEIFATQLQLDAFDPSQMKSVDFDITNNKTPETRFADNSVGKNEDVEARQQKKDINHRSSDDTYFNHSAKMPLLKDVEENVPQITMSIQSKPMDKIQSHKVGNKSLIEGIKPPKSDQHNSLQIPGPIPILESAAYNICKTNLLKRFKKQINERHKTENGKSIETNNRFSKELEKVKQVFEIKPETADKIIQVDEGDIKSVESPLTQNHIDKTEGNDNAISNVYETVHTDEYKLKEKHTSIPGISNTIDKKTMNNASEIEPNMTVHKHLKVPKQVKRAVATYRRKSGTLCFKTIPSRCLKRSHSCQCSNQKPCGGLVNRDMQPEENSQNMTIQEQGTCSTGCLECSRYTSIATTELEKSFMVEPTDEQEKPTKSNRQDLDEPKRLSIFEKKYSSKITNTPVDLHKKAEISTFADNGSIETKNSNSTPPATSICKMQEKLNTIAEELEHVKKMMQCQQQSNQRNSLENQVSEILGDWDRARSPLTLKEGVARYNLSDTPAPRCVFTLHIGTVVLSDEAVLNSRNKSLALTWKFYDQNVSMSRMHAGRVVLFDFSTEYDILLTDEFLNYMKHEEMPILICELEKQEQPYARCALPLRDALLHTNIRADMSLALVAGPKMIYARSQNSEASDALDSGDEMGVMDLWCMLQIDAKLMPIIERAIARPSMALPLSHTRKDSRVMLQVISQNEIVHGSKQDFLHRPKVKDKSISTEDKAKEENTQLHRWGSSVLRLPSKEVNDVISGNAFNNIIPQGIYKNEENNYDKHMSLSKRRNSSVLRLPNTVPIDRGAAYPKRNSNQRPKSYRYNECKHKTKESTSFLHERGDPEARIIINQVIPNIKTSADMKEAMIAKTRNSLHNIARIPKVEDKNVFDKLQRRGLVPMSYKDHLASFSKSRKTSDQEVEPTVLLPLDTIDDKYDDISKKYDNFGKLYCYKTDPSKRSVKIDSNSRCETVEGIQEIPQKDKPNAINETELQTIDITILWLALNEECEAMSDPRIQRVYVAYSFLGRYGADLETPVSLPKPKHYVDKCYFNFKKSFQLEDEDIPLLGHMARCRASTTMSPEPRDCIVFSVISEPPDDILSVESCEDIGYAYIYLGDLLAYSVGNTGYTEVTPVRAKNGSSVCGVLAVRVDGLDVLRRCVKITNQNNIRML